MIRAARALAGMTQDELAKAADLPIQTISRMEESGGEPIVSRDSTNVAVLAALGRAGVMMQPRGVALVHNKTPAEDGQVSATAGAGG